MLSNWFQISVKFIKSGADDFILKPFEPEEFFCRINQAANIMDNVNELKQRNDELKNINEEKNQLLGIASLTVIVPTVT